MPSPSKPNVLLVDDRPENLLSLKASLEGLGYDLVTACSGAEALKCLLQNDFAAIVLDVQMPEMDGFETAMLIRARRRSQNTPILFLTAVYQSDKDQARGYEVGGTDYLIKPIPPDVLRAKIAAVVKAWEGMREISERLRASEERYRQIVEVANEGIWMLDPELRTAFVNRSMAEMLGYRVEEMVGHSLFEFVFEEERPALESALQRRKQGISEVVDLRFRRKDGSELWALVSTAPILDEHGGFAGALGMFSDITQRKKIERELHQRTRELEEADRRKDHYIAMLGHELRNPLSAIRSALHLLNQVSSQDEHPTRLRAVIERQSRQLSRLLDDLLDVTRITHGRLQLRKEPVDLASVLSGAVETCRVTVEERHHELTVTIPNEPIWVDGDAMRLEQIVSNLVSNAASYTEPGGSIRVSAERKGSDVLLRVQDTGMGIPPDLLPRIFDPFVQAARTPDRPGGGLGIGLTLVRELVERHGGAVEAHSGGVGRGSEFVVRLPALPSPPPERLSGSEEFTPAAKLRILVVEDHVDAASTLSDLLKISGHEVSAVHEGSAALDAVRAAAPDVVILDIGLPEMSGYEVARRLREWEARQAAPEGARIVIVATTGYGQSEYERLSREAGSDYHLVKPLDLTALQRILFAVAETRAKRDLD